jgi:hypothetical protein
MQGSLGQMLGKPITGLYFASLEASSRWKRAGHTVRGYLGEDVTAVDRSAILSNRLMLENILCDVTPSVERVSKSATGAFEPVYSGETSPARMKLIGSIQRGALAFVDDTCRTLGAGISEVDFNPDVTTPLLQDFLASPSAADAKLFAGSMLEDSFSGAGDRYFISPLKNGTASYWKAGKAALSLPTNTQATGEASQLDTKRARVEAVPSQGKNQQLVKATTVEGNKKSAVAVSSLKDKKQPPSKQIPFREANSLYRRSLMPIVRPVIVKIGSKKDLKKFNADPSGFFADLRNPWYRGFGSMLFPSKGKRMERENEDI